MGASFTVRFKLTDETADLEAARRYLKEIDQNIIKTIKNEALRNKVDSINWVLSNEKSGTIFIMCNKDITVPESEELENWIKRQSIDGIGEGFSQQDFAEYENKNHEWITCRIIPFYGENFYVEGDVVWN